MRRTAILLVGLAILAACSEKPTATEANDYLQPSAAASTRGLGAEVQKDLATLRSVTAGLHSFEAAKDAGWNVKITDCMAIAEGGMGLHFGNPKFIDGKARVNEPELLLFEPQKNGQMRLVGIEYIIPYTELSRESEPPVLFGRQFSRVDSFQLWGMHAWVWKENPSGMFADWNPTVSCANAPALSAMSH
jgi:hypothetical protein